MTRVLCLSVLFVLASGIGFAQPSPRLRAVIRAYLVASGYPHGRPGYVVDHAIPLCAGGPDAIPNLRWQERQASYRKDIFERQLCADMHRLGVIMIQKP